MCAIPAQAASDPRARISSVPNSFRTRRRPRLMHEPSRTGAPEARGWPVPGVDAVYPDWQEARRDAAARLTAGSAVDHRRRHRHRPHPVVTDDRARRVTSSCTPASPQTRQRIAGLFWPDSTDAQALTNLRRELHHLRRTLGDEPVPRGHARTCAGATPRPRGSTCAPSTSERRRRRWRADRRRGRPCAMPSAALAEYGGRPAARPVRRLAARRPGRAASASAWTCATCSAEHAGAGGDLAGALEAARRRIRLAPLEEAGYRTLMELQAELGDRAGAVSTYHHCASVLERELGVVPGRGHARGRCSGSWRSTARPARGRRPARRSRPRPGRAPAQLVGRAASWAGCREVWRRRRRGPPGPGASSAGGAGVGKTRLVAELAALARAAGAVVATQPVLRHRRAGWRWPRWRTGCAPRRSSPRPRRWTRCGAPRSTGWCPSGTGPRRARRPGPGPWSTPGSATASSRGSPAALLGVGRPTLLVLDNLQWCDQETLAFLTFFLGLAADGPGPGGRDAARRRRATDDPRSRTGSVRMRAARPAHRVALGPLEAADTAASPRRSAARPLLDGDRDLLHATTGGFPLYVVEACAPPPTPAARRCRPVTSPPCCATRLEQASPGRPGGGRPGRGGRPRLHPRPAHRGQRPRRRQRGRRPSTSCGGAGSSASAATATTSPTTCSATPAYELVSPPRRWLLHRRLAQGLELLHADDTDAVAAQLAEQYARGGRPDRAVAYYRRPPRSRPAVSPTPRRSGCTRRRWRSCGRQPAGRDRDGQELDVLEAMAAPLNARHGYSSPELQTVLERSVALAESLGRDDSAAQRPGRALGLAVRPGTHRRRAPDRDPGPGLVPSPAPSWAARPTSPSAARPSARACRPRRCATSSSPRRARRPAPSLSVGTRPDVHGWPGRRTPTGCSATTTRPCPAAQEAVALARVHRPPLQPRGRAGLRRASPTSCSATVHALAGAVAELRGALRPVRLRLLPRVGAGPGRLVQRRRGGDRADRARDRPTCARQGSFARMPYWLSLLADGMGRAGQRRRGPGHPRRRGRQRGGPRRPVVAAGGAADARRVRRPRGRRRRPALRGCRPGVRARQRRAAAGAASTTSPCAAFGRRRRPNAVARRGAPRHERCANAPVPSVGPISTLGPKEHHHDHHISCVATAPYDELAAALRGDLITPADPRLRRGARRLQRHDRQATRRPSPGAATPPTSSPACGSPAQHDLTIAVRGGGHNAAGLGVWDDALVDRPVARCAAPPSTRANGTVRVDGGCTWGDVDHATVGFGMATPVRLPRLHRRRRADPRRRHRLPDPPLRADRRQPALRRRGPGRRHVRHRQRDLAPRPVLGAARRRRQLRRRHLVHLPLPRDRRGRHGRSAARSSTTSPTPPR